MPLQKLTTLPSAWPGTKPMGPSLRPIPSLFSLGARKQGFRDRFWTHLQLYWTEERVQWWRNALLKDDGTELCQNILTLAPSVHGAVFISNRFDSDYQSFWTFLSWFSDAIGSSVVRTMSLG